MAIFEDAEGEWHEQKAFVRGLDEKQYRPIESGDADLDLQDFIVSPDRPLIYANVWRRSVQPKLALHEGKLTPVEGKVSRGRFWEATYTLMLHDAKLIPLDPPEGFGGKPQNQWISRLMGTLREGVLHVTIGVKRPATPGEWEAMGGKGEARNAQVVDYFLAEYDTDSGGIKKVSLLMSPFY